jgi:hypothetical protein
MVFGVASPGKHSENQPRREISGSVAYNLPISSLDRQPEIFAESAVIPEVPTATLDVAYQ